MRSNTAIFISFGLIMCTIGILSFVKPIKLLQLYNYWPYWVSKKTGLGTERQKDYLYTLYSEPDKIKERYPIAILAIESGGLIALVIGATLFCKVFGIY